MDYCNICDNIIRRNKQERTKVINYAGVSRILTYCYDDIYDSHSSCYFLICNNCRNPNYTYEKNINIPDYIPIKQKKRYLKAYFKNHGKNN